MDELADLYVKLRQLHRAGLYESVDTFITYCQPKMSATPIYHMFLALQAEALHELNFYEKAELTYKKALQFNKCFSSSQLKNFDGRNTEEQTQAAKITKLLGTPEYEIISENGNNLIGLSLGASFYLSLAQTQLARKNYSAALQSLLTIPVESRCLKVEVLILEIVAKQLGSANATTSKADALNDLLQFLKKWPVALSLITLYLKVLAPIQPETIKEICGVVEKALVDAKLSSTYTNWVVNWIRLQALDFVVPTEKYASQLQQIVTNIQTSIGSTPANLVAAIAICQSNIGLYEHARANFAEARRKDPYILVGMTKYCYLLYLARNIHMLDVVATKLTSFAPESVEALVALAYYCYALATTSKSLDTPGGNQQSQKISRVLYIAHKALLVDSRNVEALLLKAKALWSKSINKHEEALEHYLEALKCRFWCFDIYSDLVECQMSKSDQSVSLSALNKQEGLLLKSPIATAFSAIKKCGKNARTLTLLARVFKNGPNIQEKANATIDKALEMDPKYSPAILLKADIMLSEVKKPLLSSLSNRHSDQAIKFLKSKLEDASPESAILIHEKLAVLCAGSERKEEELVHRNAVLSLSRLPHDGSDIAGTGLGTLSGRVSEDDFQHLDAVGSAYGDLGMEVDPSAGFSGRTTGNGWHSTFAGTETNDVFLENLSF